MMDNASSHGTTENLPTLQHVDIIFLPKNATFRMQPLDLGIIASVKYRYRGKQIERAVNLLDSGVRDDLYKTNIRTAISYVYDIWQGVDSSIVHNCWIKTQLIDATEE